MQSTHRMALYACCLHTESLYAISLSLLFFCTIEANLIENDENAGKISLFSLWSLCLVCRVGEVCVCALPIAYITSYQFTIIWIDYTVGISMYDISRK